MKSLFLFPLLCSCAIACIPMKVTISNRCKPPVHHQEDACQLVSPQFPTSCAKAEISTTSVKCADQSMDVYIGNAEGFPQETADSMMCIGTDWYMVILGKPFMLDSALVSGPVLCVPKIH